MNVPFCLENQDYLELSIILFTFNIFEIGNKLTGPHQITWIGQQVLDQITCIRWDPIVLKIIFLQSLI